MDVIDARGLRCPMPLLQARRFLASAHSGQQLEVWTSDLGSPADFEAYCAQTGHVFVGAVREQSEPPFFKITLVKSS